MIKIKSINGVPETAPPEIRFGSFFDGTHFNFFQTQEEADKYFASLPVPESVEEPIIVAAWQLRLYLAEMGLKPQIDAIIDTLVDPLIKLRVQTVWEYGNTINSDSPLIKMLAHEMGLSKEEVKEIFTNANQIEL
jgi:hypothetical protein